MKNKVTIGLVTLLGIVIITIITILCLNYFDSSNTVVSTEESSDSDSESDSISDSESDTGIDTEESKNFEFDLNIEFKGSDSYVNNPEEALKGDNTIIDHIETEYSSGFTLQDTEHTHVNFYYTNEGKIYSDVSDGIIYVKEHDALNTTVQQLRLDTLNKHAAQLYLGYDPHPIPRDAEVTFGVGLKDWQNYFEYQPSVDPTIDMSYQIFCDTTAETAFGNALYVELYDLVTNKYVAYAFILCERDRIISVSIEDSNRENLYPLLVEVTNDAITLVK